MGFLKCLRTGVRESPEEFKGVLEVQVQPLKKFREKRLKKQLNMHTNTNYYNINL